MATAQTSATSATQRAAIRAALAEARIAYHALLAQVPDQAWERPTGNQAWNVRQLFHHMTTGLHWLPLDVRLILAGRNPKPPPWLFNVVNKWYNIWAARGHTRASLAAEYDRRHRQALALLDSLSDDDLAKAGLYPDIGGNMTGGRRTIADMFHYVARHVEEHRAELLQAIGEAPP